MAVFVGFAVDIRIGGNGCSCRNSGTYTCVDCMLYTLALTDRKSFFLRANNKHACLEGFRCWGVERVRWSCWEVVGVDIEVQNQ